MTGFATGKRKAGTTLMELIIAIVVITLVAAVMYHLFYKPRQLPATMHRAQDAMRLLNPDQSMNISVDHRDTGLHEYFILTIKVEDGDPCSFNLLPEEYFDPVLRAALKKCGWEDPWSEPEGTPE